jgi:diguanylate cyclase (GGDEF)-like protein
MRMTISIVSLRGKHLVLVWVSRASCSRRSGHCRHGRALVGYQKKYFLVFLPGVKTMATAIPGLGRALKSFPIQPLLDVVVRSLTSSLAIEGVGIGITFKRARTLFVAGNSPDVVIVENVQAESREGPGAEAAATGKFVEVRDVSASKYTRFAAEAMAHGYHSVFAFPLGDTVRAVGSMCLYLTETGPLSEDRMRIAQAVTAVTTEFLLNAQQKLVEIIDVQQRGAVGIIDKLTGLPVGEAHRAEVEGQEIEGKGGTESVAILFLDLDRFKLINDTHGHEVGNQLLVAVAQRLAGLTREGEVLTREGGDEFVVFCSRTTISDITYLAERIKRAFEYPFVLPKNVISIQASIGMAISEPGSWFDSTLFSQADEAMYRVKRQGGADFEFYDPDVEEKEKDTNILADDLAHAIERGQLSLDYQPVCEAANGTVVGCEALLRWNHPVRGLVPAKETIYLAEQRGLMPSIGYWIFEEAFRNYREVSEQIPGLNLMISLNVSPLQLMDREFAERIHALSLVSGMTLSNLSIEVTESTLFNDGDTAKSALNGLMARGAKVCLDGFGTGFSSLGHLQEFTVSQVKVDRSFVQRAPTDKIAYAVLTSVTALGLSLGTPVVAEGVETQQQHDMALKAGCTLAQGYFHFRPGSLQELIAILKKQAGHTLVGAKR